MPIDPTRVRDIASELVETLPEPPIAGRLLAEARKSGAFTAGRFVGAGVLVDELAAQTPAGFGRLWDGVLSWFIYSEHGERLPLPELPAPPDKPAGTRRYGPPEPGAFHRLVADVLVESVAGEPEAATPATADPDQPGGVARALALLVEHPGWTDIKIAEHAKVSTKTLQRSKPYKAARDAQRTARTDAPRGWKHGRTGDLDARAD